MGLLKQGTKIGSSACRYETTDEKTGRSDCDSDMDMGSALRVRHALTCARSYRSPASKRSRTIQRTARLPHDITVTTRAPLSDLPTLQRHQPAACPAAKPSPRSIISKASMLRRA